MSLEKKDARALFRCDRRQYGYSGYGERGKAVVDDLWSVSVSQWSRWHSNTASRELNPSTRCSERRCELGRPRLSDAHFNESFDKCPWQRDIDRELQCAFRCLVIGDLRGQRRNDRTAVR